MEVGRCEGKCAKAASHECMQGEKGFWMDCMQTHKHTHMCLYSIE